MTIEEIKKVPADSIVVMTPHWFASRILTLPPEQFKNIQLTSVHEFGSIGHIGTTKILGLYWNRMFLNLSLVHHTMFTFFTRSIINDVVPLSSYLLYEG